MAVFVRRSNCPKGRTSVNGLRSTVHDRTPSIRLFGNRSSFLLGSGRLLQPNQPSLRLDHWVLLTPVVPRNESDWRVGRHPGFCWLLFKHSQIWISMARLREFQAAYKNACSRIYWTSNGLGSRKHRQRGYVSEPDW